MRKDLAKVLTERPRSGSNSRNLKTGFQEHGYDDRETKEDKYSLPKHGKMLMHNQSDLVEIVATLKQVMCIKG